MFNILAQVQQPIVIQPVNPLQITNGYQVAVIMGPSILALIGIIFTAIISGRNKKDLSEVKKDVKVFSAKQEDMHTKTNSRLDELIASIKTASHAEGKAEGIKEEQDRIANKLRDATDIAKDKIKEAAEVAKNQLTLETKIAREKLIREVNEKIT